MHPEREGEAEAGAAALRPLTRNAQLDDQGLQRGGGGGGGGGGHGGGHHGEVAWQGWQGTQRTWMSVGAGRMGPAAAGMAASQLQSQGCPRASPRAHSTGQGGSRNTCPGCSALVWLTLVLTASSATRVALAPEATELRLSPETTTCVLQSAGVTVALALVLAPGAGAGLDRQTRSRFMTRFGTSNATFLPIVVGLAASRSLCWRCGLAGQGVRSAKQRACGEQESAPMPSHARACDTPAAAAMAYMLSPL